VSSKRRLAAMHPPLTQAYVDGTNWDPMPGTQETGWEQLATGSGWFHETQIDLSGYALQDMTFFPSAVGIQDPGLYRMKADPSSTTSGLFVLDLITSTPINPDDIMVTDLVGQNFGPGMFGSDETFETIVYGLFRFFGLNSTITIEDYQQLQRSQRFDSGEPTAADKLYCYRIVQITATALQAAQSYILVPAARQLIAGYMNEESDLVYMQRLKRSYELANQVRQ